MEEEEVVVEKVDALDWLQLPDHLYFEIMGKLTCFFDYARFGAVCVKWRSLIFNENKEEEFLPPQLPLLLVPTPPPHNEKADEDVDEEKYNYQKKKKTRRENAGTSTTRSCSFYRITDKKVVCPQIQLKMPLDRHFRGSGHGWLVTMDNDKSSNFPVQLINPFFFPEPMVIPLPPLTAFPSELHKDETGPDPVYGAFFLQKAVLSADPISNPMDYMVTVIWSSYSRLAFFKPGGKAWRTVAYDSSNGSFEDVIHYKGKVYAVHNSGALAICDMEKCMAMKILDPMVGIKASRRKYLVESSGELLQVHREVKSKFPAYSTRSFKVFKLSLDQMGVIRKPDWEEVRDLGAHTLFLGHNHSMSITASDFPGCKPNCIYYTDEYIEAHLLKPTCGPHDMGVFNLEDGSIEKHYPTNIHESIWPNPIWIEPRLPPKKQAI